MKYLIRQDKDGVFRAYQEGTVPVYLGGETAEACRKRVLDYYQHAEVEIDPALITPSEPAHVHHPASVHFTPPPPGLRRTGVHQQEVCRCGMKRHVWISTFTVDAGAWE